MLELNVRLRALMVPGVQRFHLLLFLVFFFFSSRRRHTRSDRDWSSDVCSSDLACANLREAVPYAFGYMMSAKVGTGIVAELGAMRISEEIDALEVMGINSRSEERRVGKECRSRWSPYH